LNYFIKNSLMAMSQTIQTTFNNAVSEGKVKNTLGARISILKNWMQEHCLKKQSKRDARIGLCCDRLQERVGAYGCDIRTRRKRKYPRRKKFKKFTYNKRKHRGKKFYRKKKKLP
jgi:hypothetical protein